MALKVLSRGFLKTENRRVKFDQITIKILGRPCLIGFSSPKSMNKFKQVQNEEPQLINGNILDIDCINIKVPKVPPKDITTVDIPEPEYTGNYSGNSFERYMDRIRRIKETNEARWNANWEKHQAALAKFEERVKNAGDRIQAKKDEVRDIFGVYTFYIYKNNLYYFNSPDIHSEEDQQLLVKKYYVKQQKQLDKFQKELEIIERLASEPEISRESIPESIRMFVWRRDGGKCVRCGRKENLEFDHIIPVSKGGSNTERNIQILCEHCNREKSDKI